MNRIIRILFGILIGLMLVAGLTLFLQSTAVLAQTPTGRSSVLQAGLGYLQAQQQEDGGIMGFSGVSDPDTTARSVMAFILAGEPVTIGVSPEGNSMLDYLETQAISFTHDTTGTLFPGRAGELLSAVSLAGQDPVDFGGMDLVSELEASFQLATGTFSTTARQDFSSGQASDLNQAWSILGLSLAGKNIPDGASHYLVQSQGEDGSWGFGDPDTTALVVTALIASHQVNVQDQAIQGALQYFHDGQLDSGGWKPSWDTDPLNADSTGWILQALISAGEEPTGESWSIGDVNPVDALKSLQKPDGSIGGTYANTYSTADAIIGLSGEPLFNPGPTPASHKAGLAVFFGDGSVFTSCISFSPDSINGLDLLNLSRLNIVSATNPTQGTAVCKIGEVGSQSPEDCFSEMPNYWSYWQLGANGWEYSVIGADKNQVMDGDVNAWNWGSGDPPALISFQNICEGVPFVLPTATQPSLPPTDTPSPTQMPSSIPATVISLPTPTPLGSTNTPGTYIVYGSILIVLTALVVYLIRYRRK